MISKKLYKFFQKYTLRRVGRSLTPGTAADAHPSDTGSPITRLRPSPDHQTNLPPTWYSFSWTGKWQRFWVWPNAVQRTADRWQGQLALLVRPQRPYSDMFCWTLWDKDRRGDRTEHGQGKRRRTVLFLLQVLLSETATLTISSHLKSTLSVSLNIFFSCFTWTIAIF